MSLGGSVLDAIGNTPLVRLRRVSHGVRPRIYAKLEFMNPGGSVKDRIAAYLVTDAEKRAPAEERRDHHRADLREHGRRPGDARGRPGLQGDIHNARQGQRGEEGPAHGLRGESGCRAYRAPADLARPLHQRGTRGSQKETPNSFMPNQYENLGQPEGPLRDDRPGDLASDRWASRCARRGGRDGRHDLRSWKIPEEEEEVPARGGSGARGLHLREPQARDE